MLKALALDVTGDQLGPALLGQYGFFAKDRAQESLSEKHIYVLADNYSLRHLSLPITEVTDWKLYCPHVTLQACWRAKPSDWELIIATLLCPKQLQPVVLDCPEYIACNVRGYERIVWTPFNNFSIMTRFVKRSAVRAHRQDSKLYRKIQKAEKYRNKLLASLE